MRPACFVAIVLASWFCLTLAPASAAEAEPNAQGDAAERVGESLDRGLVARPTDGGKVYVHCALGWSRSTRVAMDWLVAGGLEPERAMQRLREVRPRMVPVPTTP